MRVALHHRPIDVAALLAEVGDSGNGACVSFVGTVREINDGRAVTGIDYEAYEAMAERELSAIAKQASLRFETTHIVVEHRLGTLALGDASVAIVVAHPHRGAAFDAARWIIEELKCRVPIWKREHYVDGDVRWVRADVGSAPPLESTR